MGGWVVASLKVSTFPILLNITPTKKSNSPVPLLMTHHILEKKVSLIRIHKFLPKILPVVCVFSYAIMEKLSRTKPSNTEQCTAGEPLRIIPQVSPVLQKISPPLIALLHPPGVGCPDLPLNLYEKTWGLERILPNSQEYTYFLHQKKSPFIDLHLLVSEVSFLPPSNRNFHVSTLCKLHL